MKANGSGIGDKRKRGETLRFDVTNGETNVTNRCDL